MEAGHYGLDNQDTKKWKEFRSKMVAGCFGLGNERGEKKMISTRNDPCLSADCGGPKSAQQQSKGGEEAAIESWYYHPRKSSSLSASRSRSQNQNVAMRETCSANGAVCNDFSVHGRSLHLAGTLSRKLQELDEAFHLGLIDKDEFITIKQGVLDNYSRKKRLTSKHGLVGKSTCRNMDIKARRPFKVLNSLKR